MRPLYLVHRYGNSAEATYGPISSWDVRAITDMSSLFYTDLAPGYDEYYDGSEVDKTACNPDINNWDMSGVTNTFGASLPTPLQPSSHPSLGPRLTGLPPRVCVCRYVLRRDLLQPGHQQLGPLVQYLLHVHVHRHAWLHLHNRGGLQEHFVPGLRGVRYGGGQCSGEVWRDRARAGRSCCSATTWKALHS